MPAPAAVTVTLSATVARKEKVAVAAPGVSGTRQLLVVALQVSLRDADGKPVRGYLYQDRLRPAAELDGAGKVISQFVYVRWANAPEYMIKGGSVYRLISDHLGSPRLVVEAAIEDYDEMFGK